MMNDFVVTINDKKIKIFFEKKNLVSIEGQPYYYNFSKLNNDSCKLVIENKSYLLTSKKNGNSGHIISVKGEVFEAKVLSALQEKAVSILDLKKSKHSQTNVKAPMPGMILKIKKKAGDEILHGESLLILEAMKMENELRAPLAGKIKEIKVKEGEPVEKGTVLLVIE